LLCAYKCTVQLDISKRQSRVFETKLRYKMINFAIRE
jgi:hypothetical protein